MAPRLPSKIPAKVAEPSTDAIYNAYLNRGPGFYRYVKRNSRRRNYYLARFAPSRLPSSMTIDVPMLGKRERDVRNRLTLPDHLSLKNLLQAGCQEFSKDVATDSGLAAYVASLFDPALTWKDIEWLVRVTKLPVLVKGILRTDDALRAVNHGASGIIVSNHGARQLDTTPATISVLPEIVDAVAGAVEVYVDGGIRRGTDVLKAMAYGARAVLVGRPILWGLAVGGEAGVKSVLEMLRQEFDLAMALSGCPRLSDVTRDLVRPL